MALLFLVRQPRTIASARFAGSFTPILRFEKLEIKGEPKPNVLEYSFVFREVMEKKQKTETTYFDCENGQTLWDVAYKTGVKIDELVRLNPDVKFPDDDLGTRRVRLC